MEQLDNNKPAVWFWVVSVLALIWNLMGVFAYYARVTITEEALTKLPESQQALMTTAPAWYTGAFAIAVFAATLGCILLLMRKRVAIWLFVVSLIAVIAQQVYHFLLSDIGKSLPTADLVMTAMIPFVGVLLIWLSRAATEKHWLH